MLSNSGGVAGEEGGGGGVGAMDSIPDSGLSFENETRPRVEKFRFIRAQALGRGHGMSGVSDRLGGVREGSIERRTEANGSGRSVSGDPCFVMLIQGPATLPALAPKVRVFDFTSATLEPACCGTGRG